MEMVFLLLVIESRIVGTTALPLKGRADSITKVGGKRVDLEEICSLIKKEPGVADCVVIALPESRGREHRIARLDSGDCRQY